VREIYGRHHRTNIILIYDQEVPMKLAEMTCSPLKKGTAPLSHAEEEAMMPQISAWLLAEKELAREFRFKDFREAMAFVNRIAVIANEQDHHPDIGIFYNIVKITLSTHKIGGLSLNDFILAAKIDSTPLENFVL
jgi:4a-hydroxytetrahydrobiopterin dehydratase